MAMPKNIRTLKFSIKVIERRLIRVIKDMEWHLFENNQNEESKILRKLTEVGVTESRK